MDNDYVENEAQLAAFRGEISKLQKQGLTSETLAKVVVSELQMDDMLIWEEIKAILKMIGDDFMTKKADFDREISVVSKQIGRSWRHRGKRFAQCIYRLVAKFGECVSRSFCVY